MAQTQMVRIPKRTHKVIQELAEHDHETLADVIDHAVEDYRRKRFFDDLDAAYVRLEAEGRHPDSDDDFAGTLADGIDDETEVWQRAGSAAARG